MSDKKIALLIFLSAFILRLFVFWSFDSEKSLLYVADSLTYLETAKNMLEHGVYSMEISDTPHSDNFRSPLYPAFLLPFLEFKTSLYLPALFGAIFMSVAAVLIFLLGKKIFERKTASLGALLFALEPVGAIISSQIMSEALFMLFFVPAIFELAHFIKNQNRRELFLGALFLALSALTRPAALWLFLLVPIAFFLGDFRRERAKDLGIAFLIFLSVLSPWLFYNAYALGTWEFSSQPSMALYTYHAKFFSEWLGEPQALRKVNYDAMEKYFDARVIPEMKETALELITSRPLEYAWFHLVKTYRLFTDSGFSNVLNGLSFRELHYDGGGGGFLESGDFQKLSQGPFLAILLLADLFFILIASLAILNPFFSRDKTRWLLFSVIVLYAFLASPIGGPRFRIPINPLLFLLALESILFSYKHVRKTYFNIN